MIQSSETHKINNNLQYKSIQKDMVSSVSIYGPKQLKTICVIET